MPVELGCIFCQWHTGLSAANTQGRGEKTRRINLTKNKESLSHTKETL